MSGCSRADPSDATRSSPSGPCALTSREVQLWLLPTCEGSNRALAEACRRLLSPDEEKRRGTFHFEADRNRHALTRALVRLCLSHSTGVDAAAWSFAAGEHGRPEIGAPHTQVPLRFNVSHTPGWIACLVGLQRDLGVDVECLERRVGWERLTARALTPAERADLCARPPSERRERFLAYWTLKEAYLKARGLGLRLPMDRVEVCLAANGRARLRHAEADGGDPGEWQLRLLRPCPGLLTAIALRRSEEAEVEIRHFDAGLRIDRSGVSLHAHSQRRCTP